MRVAPREKTIGVRGTGIFLDCQKELCRRFIELVLKEIGPPHRGLGVTCTLAWAQAERGLDMLDREIVLTGQEPDLAAKIPATGEARVERERTVDQPGHGADVLAETCQHKRGVSEDARVVLPPIASLPGKLDALGAIYLHRVAPSLNA